jgi:choice-of-anchor B domain-containing protein
MHIGRMFAIMDHEGSTEETIMHWLGIDRLRHLFAIIIVGTLGHQAMGEFVTHSPSTGGPAVTFEAENVVLRGWIPLDAFAGNPSAANDIWGYVSPSGREYAVLGLQTGTGFVDVTDPANPVVVGFIPTNGLPGTTRDVKVFDQYAYSIGDSAAGLEVIDLTQIDAGVVSLVIATTQGGLFDAHNLALNPDSGFAYPVASNLTSGLVAYDLSVPTAPQFAGSWSGSLIHDAHVVSYTTGPFAGQEIAFGFAGPNGLITIDVTDKANMTTLATVTYPNLSYCHQGWLSEDRQYLFVADELDEVGGNVATTTTYVFDVSDVANPVFLNSFTSGLPATDHNLVVEGDFVFEANYASGLRVFDASSINAVTEVGFFDTHPETNASGFPGAWGVYPGLPSGTVIVSDRQRGLFIFDASQATNPTSPVPTVSTWGTIIMTLLCITAGTAIFRRRAEECMSSYHCRS